MSKPLISIVIPAYNASKFIGETIESVQKQAYDNWELIVIDDGSKDNTAEVVARYVKGDKRIQYHHQENAGQYEARFAGLKKAKGEIISFLDSDNLLMPNVCEHAISIFNQEKCDVVYGDVKIFFNGKPEELYNFNLENKFDEVTVNALLQSNFINLLGTFIRKEKLNFDDDFGKHLRRSDDHILWFKLALNKAKFMRVPDTVGLLRFHGNNLSFDNDYLINTAKTNLEIIAWLEKRLKDFPNSNASTINQLQKFKRHSFLMATVGSIAVKNKKESYAYLEHYKNTEGNKIKSSLLWIGLLVVPISLLAKAMLGARKLYTLRRYTIIRQ